MSICDCNPYGDQIPIRCTKCGAMYSTKNIDYIGARTVFPAEHESCECDWKYLEHACEGYNKEAWRDEIKLFIWQERSKREVEELLRRGLYTPSRIASVMKMFRQMWRKRKEIRSEY